MNNQPEAGSRRAEINRQNAQKSTGPRTQAGKARSSRNSTRHALLAKAATLMAQPNQELESILARFHADLRPSSIHEEVLVQQMAVAAWRLRQSARIEVGLQSVQMQETYDHLLNAGKPIQWRFADVTGFVPQPAEPEESETPELADAGEDTRTAAMGAAWAANPAVFALLLRYHNQATRDYFRAMKHLELLRTGQAGYLPDEQPPAMAKSIQADPAPAESETKPTAAPHKAAAAAAASETKPTATASAQESDTPARSNIPLPQQRSSIPPRPDENQDSIKSS
jgi:hypothetical protein